MVWRNNNKTVYSKGIKSENNFKDSKPPTGEATEEKKVCIACQGEGRLIFLGTFPSLNQKLLDC